MNKRVSLEIIGALVLSAMGAGAITAQTPETTSVTALPSTTQTPQPEKSPRKTQRRPPTGRVTVVPSQDAVAPQVVTIIHRLSGVKILRFLLRQSAQSGIVETIDPESVNDDAHASIIAGWALDDGKTIAARLPQAAAEIEIKEFEGPLGTQGNKKPDPFTSNPFMLARRAVEPDLTVVTRDGRKLKARLIGLDAETGLSVMQIVGGLIPLPQAATTPVLAEGQGIQIFAPERTRPEGEAGTLNTYVTVGKIDATVAKVKRDDQDVFDGLVVRGAELSPDAIGGVACDPSGNTLGIVESINDRVASIVTTNIIRAATQRVLERQASVPRPVLGVRGEFVEFAKRADFLAHGWRDDQLDALISAGNGILLTGVVPRTPAAMASLQAGDIILSVNNNLIISAEQFSRLLGQAGSGKQVEFGVRRPAVTDPLSVPVTLGGSFAPLFEWRFEMPRMKPFGLQSLGIESMALTAKVASQLGAEGGLIVVAVLPESAGAQAGIQEGDVIESVDGRVVDHLVWGVSPMFSTQKKHVLSIVRGREKKRVVVEVKDSGQ